MAFFNRDKILTFFFAAKTQLCYPTIQCLTFHLADKGLTLEGYNFSLSSHSPYANLTDAFRFPQSMSLTADLNFLVGVDLLVAKTSPVVVYALGQRAANVRDGHIDTFNSLGEMQFEELETEIKSALSDLRRFYDHCYRRYIVKL